MAVTVSVNVLVQVTWAGLTPGTSYESSVTFSPADGTDGFEVGQNAHKVGANGSYVVGFDQDWVSGNKAGHYRVWLRPPGSFQDAEPATGPNGPLATEFDIPEA